MNTETIASVKPVLVAGREMNIVTSASGQTVWVTKEQMVAGAETITYKPRKAGEEYVKKDGSKDVLKSDRNDLVGFGKQTKLAIIQALFAQGLNPTLSLG